MRRSRRGSCRGLRRCGGFRRGGGAGRRGGWRRFRRGGGGLGRGGGGWMFGREGGEHGGGGGATVLGEGGGYGSTCDGYHRVQISPDVVEPVRAMELALADGGVGKGDVGY